MKNNKKFIQSVQRAIDIVNCFSKNNIELSLKEISDMLNINKSTVHGIINTLKNNSFIVQNKKTKKHKLGIVFMEKGSFVSENINIIQISRDFLKIIANKYKITSHLILFQNMEIYCVDKMNSPEEYYITSSTIGRELPIHATASGKLILSYLNQDEVSAILKKGKFKKFTDKTTTDINKLKKSLVNIKKNGISFEDEEVELSILSIAAPIFNYKGEIYGTISVSGPKAKIEQCIKEIVIDLKKYANIISEKIGYRK